MSQDKPLLGVTLMLGFCVTIPIADAIAKLLGGTVPLVELVMARFAAQAFLLLPVIWATGRRLQVPRRHLGLIVLRTVLQIFGIGGMFVALMFLPLADAIAIAFVMPFFMLFLGKYVLGEEIGARRIIASIVGFLGTLLVIQPSFADVGWPALIPLFVAVVFSVFMLITRRIAKDVDAFALQSISGFIAVAILLAAAAVGSAQDLRPFMLILPDNKTLVLLLICGAAGTAAHLMMTLSLRFAPSATLAPMQYLEIPFATFVGWLVFQDLPDGLAALGILITIGAGLYVIWRERKGGQAA
jgi:drug/metabolite transporter (DMT)-like permease